ncbi:hypothetical protein [Hydrogenophaga sp.]|uniref:hypothetical protein n=1 Tax=Hydrogenophaga sp. TaxID=1904254 RepID=UPI00272496AA|nr:hypothetical protein [Hydrogenophaga sp.]MDO8904953.1 hypothetical protein [Hydrogenophaga sp.]
MSLFKLTSIAAALLVASATVMAKQPDQRAIEFAKSIADQSPQQPKAATGQGNGSIFSALQAVLNSLVKKDGTQ